MSTTKYIASISLVVMMAGFIVTCFMSGEMAQLLRNGFEGGFVGGLADWFAVTALFRHPLGIPIPHTALLPKNRQKVTNALVSVLENELLSKDSLNQKIKQMLQIEPLLTKLENILFHDAVKQGIVVISEITLRSIPVEKVAHLINKEVKNYLYSTNSGPLLRTLTEYVFNQGYDQKALDFILDQGKEMVSTREMRDRLGSMALQAFEKIEIKGFMQFTVNAFLGYVGEEKLGGIIQNFMLNFIQELSYDDNPSRITLLAEIRSKLAKTINDPTQLEKIELWKKQLVDSLSLDQKLLPVLLDLQQKAFSFIHDPEFTDDYAVPLFIQMIQNIKSDHVMINRIENGIHGLIHRFIEKNHGKIGYLVEENVNKLDNQTLIEIMEDRIGKDIQWIRVNGAICGFLIGVILGGIKMMI